MKVAAARTRAASCAASSDTSGGGAGEGPQLWKPRETQKLRNASLFLPKFQTMLPSGKCAAVPARLPAGCAAVQAVASSHLSWVLHSCCTQPLVHAGNPEKISATHQNATPTSPQVLLALLCQVFQLTRLGPALHTASWLTSSWLQGAAGQRSCSACIQAPMHQSGWRPGSQGRASAHWPAQIWGTGKSSVGRGSLQPMRRRPRCSWPQPPGAQQPFPVPAPLRRPPATARRRAAAPPATLAALQRPRGTHPPKRTGARGLQAGGSGDGAGQGRGQG